MVKTFYESFNGGGTGNSIRKRVPITDTADAEKSVTVSCWWVGLEYSVFMTPSISNWCDGEKNIVQVGEEVSNMEV